MENFSLSYNQQLHYDSSSNQSSSTGISNSSSASNGIEEEVMLASRNPKKRAGRKKFQETRHPVFRGVRRRNSGKWVCEVREPNKKSRIWLGTYETADMAARAHDVAAIALRGRSACLNFADSTWRLPVPASSDVPDIQRAAAEAAEMFGPYQSNVASVDEESNALPLPSSSPSPSPLPENMYYTDDESVFGMRELITDMAKGLMLPPPQCGGDEYGSVDNMETIADVSLWSYSM